MGRRRLAAPFLVHFSTEHRSVTFGPRIVLSAYLVLVCLMLGSFINLAADRFPRGESIVRPRSHCRSCGRVLSAVDLLPVAGYLLRRGRCATCGSRIGRTSPVVEIVSGACMLAMLV